MLTPSAASTAARQGRLARACVPRACACSRSTTCALGAFALADDDHQVDPGPVGVAQGGLDAAQAHVLLHRAARPDVRSSRAMPSAAAWSSGVTPTTSTRGGAVAGVGASARQIDALQAVREAARGHGLASAERARPGRRSARRRRPAAARPRRRRRSRRPGPCSSAGRAPGSGRLRSRTARQRTVRAASRSSAAATSSIGVGAQAAPFEQAAQVALQALGRTGGGVQLERRTRTPRAPGRSDRVDWLWPAGAG